VLTAAAIRRGCHRSGYSKIRCKSVDSRLPIHMSDPTRGTSDNSALYFVCERI
jgi:hypothetical protein